MSRHLRPKLLLACFAGFLVASGTSTLAQGLFPRGGRGLSHLNAAWVQDRGQLAITAITTSYYQTARLPKVSGRNPEFATFWDVQGGVATHYSVSRRLELTLAQTLYQDTHHDTKGANLPDDLYFAAKFGSYGGLRSKVRVGFMTSARFPLAKRHNVILEPYSAGSIELGLLGMLSFSRDVLIPENAFNFHLNFGFWHHNDTGKLLVGTRTDTFAVLDPSRALLWGAGFAIPSHQFDFTVEIFGRNFLVRPPVTAYSREDFAYLTPGVIYHPVYWAALNVAFDIRLSPDRDGTRYIAGLSQVNPALPSYPNWRVRLGARFAVNQPAPPPGQKPLFASSNGRLVPMHKNLEKQLSEEKRKTETAEEELTKIRNERKRMETMLARLRSLLNSGKAEPSTPDAQGQETKPGNEEKKEEKLPEQEQ
ncbi:MAG: hypothetical protein ONB44_18295 [candidate division KSB1 bacterium]|nr:hypothetical protein [candidate division KSB1 bacterium]MDZ7304080.1 hypothetical protein [candidate division KSB1 bacterium]MDZ7312060.1 hypothetical protein [candidate division KSB1 bacterium]